MFQMLEITKRLQRLYASNVTIIKKLYTLKIIKGKNERLYKITPLYSIF